MQTILEISAMRTCAAQAKRDGRSVALVATNGALHAGHASLMAAAKGRADFVIVSIFPNPLAFGPSENFGAYPRTLDADQQLCAGAKVDVIFTPTPEEMLPRGFSTFVTEEAVSRPLCGVSRPTHFRGVTTILAKLLNLVQPDVLIMGQRDAQQVAIVKKMIADLGFGTEVVVVPTLRESDGLAITSRNRNLTANQRREALAIFTALERGRQMAAQGVRSPDRIIAEATHLLGERRRVRVIYVSIVDPNTMEPMREVIPGRTLLAIAVWVDELRMIDNVEL